MLNFANQLQAAYREATLNGVAYLVVPGVPMREQVMKYYFVNVAEISKCATAWNGVPLTINHPRENNGSVNVPDPDVPVIGAFYNSTLDGTKLTGEFWFNVEKLRTAPGGATIEKAIRNNRMLEVSTGYFADEIDAEGSFENVPYTAVHQNLKPDHIAILPEAIGACSNENGCGVPRLNCAQNCAACASKKETTMPEPQLSLLDQIKALLLPPAATPTAALNDCGCPPAAEAAPAALETQAAAPAAEADSQQVQTNAQVMLNAEEYAYVRAYISLSADLGGTDNIKKLLLLMQESQASQAAKEAQDALDRAAELAAQVTPDGSGSDTVQNQAADEPVNYAGAVAPEPHLNAAQGLALPVAIPYQK